MFSTALALDYGLALIKTCLHRLQAATTLPLHPTHLFCYQLSGTILHKLCLYEFLSWAATRFPFSKVYCWSNVRIEKKSTNYMLCSNSNSSKMVGECPYTVVIFILLHIQCNVHPCMVQ